MSNSTETNRLPLRAGAMCLLAIAVVFAGLGLHSATKSPDPDPAAVQEATTTTTTSAADEAPAATTTTGSSSAAESSEEADAKPQLCILNAGVVRGLGASVKTELEGKGWQVSAVENFQSPSITENTVFYESGQKLAAESLVSDLGAMSASPTARPGAFTRCPGQLALVVVTK